jgi:hypothetical protein
MLAWIDSSWLAALMRQVSWLFPACETLHFIGLCMLFGGLIFIDLRTLGLAPKLSPMKLVEWLLPWVWIGFGINLVTGVMFLFTDPYFYYPNAPFRTKLVLMFLAGLNALWFQLKVHPELARWKPDMQMSTAARASAGLSLALWIGVIVFGRLIMYA